MEVGKDFLDRVAKASFDRTHAALAWWKGMPEAEQRSAYGAWLSANPEDFRAGWGFKLAAMSKNSIESVWEHHNKTNKP